MPIELLTDDNLADIMREMAQRWPGQPVGLVLIGETYFVGVISWAELVPSDWMDEPIAVAREIADGVIPIPSSVAFEAAES